MSVEKVECGQKVSGYLLLSLGVVPSRVAQTDRREVAMEMETPRH